MNIAVYLTSYNQRDHLIEAIDSVLAQTRPASQIIVVDDCSSDDSREVIESYARRHPGLFVPIMHEQNTGVARSRIDALHAVNCELVTYLDGDDQFLPNKLEVEAEALQQAASAGIAFSNNRYMNNDASRHLWTWVVDEPVPQGDIFFETFTRQFPRRSLFRMELVRYSHWRDLGFHDPSLPIYEDMDMRIRLTKAISAVYVDEVTAQIRINASGLSKLPNEAHFDTLRMVFAKNIGLLADLSQAERKQACQLLGGWIAKVGLRAAFDALKAGEPAQALKYCYNAALIARGYVR